MANTYTQIYIHLVFAVKRREALIAENFREEVQKYIAGILANREQVLIAIYCMPDHTHVFFSMKPMLNLSELVRDIKAGSAKFINDNNWVKGKFAWQEGYGAFSHSHGNKDVVERYVRNQKEHHAKRKFREEYLEMLQKNDVRYDDRYLFEWLDNHDA